MSIFKKNKIKERKMGSNGMAFKPLSQDYNLYSIRKYLNLSNNLIRGCAGMAEWSPQSSVTGYPSGRVGSIPTPSATIFALCNGGIYGIV